MERYPSFLGTGWNFPPTFTTEDKGVHRVSRVEDIMESLEILFSTRPGERIMRPDYGCNLDYLLFEPLNTSLFSFVGTLIENAVLQFEPRIDLEYVDFNLDQDMEGILNITLSCIIRTTNSRFNFVYPFYLEEAERIERRRLGGGGSSRPVI